MHHGVFGFGSVIPGYAIGIIPEFGKLPLNAPDVRSVVVQLDAIFLRVGRIQHFLDRGRSDAVQLHIGCTLEQHNGVSRGFVEQRSGFVALHITEVHQFLLQRCDGKIVVVELKRGIMRNGDAVIGGRDRRSGGRNKRRGGGTRRVAQQGNGVLPCRQIFRFRIGVGKRRNVPVTKNEKQTHAAQNGGKRQCDHDA